MTAGTGTGGTGAGGDAPLQRTGRARRGGFASRPLRLALCATRAIGVIVVVATVGGALASTATGALASTATGGGPAWEEHRRADEAALAERWPELEAAAEEAIKQRFREIREQADQAMQALDALGREMDQLHRRRHEELRARHEQERATAAAEGAGAVERADARHRQELEALRRDQKAERDRLAEARDELDRHLEGARDDVARARKEALGDEAGARRTISRLHVPEHPGAHEEPGTNEEPGAASEPVVASGPEQAGEPVAAESGPNSQVGQPDSGQPDSGPPDSGETEDRPQQAAPPEAAEAAAPPQELADLVERGNAMLDFGDLASARLFYQHAAGRGSAEGAMLMGMTFDPLYFAGAGIHGTQPRIQDALEWYGKAIAMGSLPAQARMGRLRSWLEHSAAGGDAQAAAALRQFR
jgi:hypothetical protein